jgi:serine/threonine protein kinase
MGDMMKKFGKYFLLDQIAQGGMAEIYRARMATPDGGGRLLAIKRIIQTYSSNPEFVTMFKSEIKTTSGFTHPNIVQVYDYGEEQSLFYIAMEYVDGRNLRQFISRFAELKIPFPIEAAVFILEQAAHGMAYAHGYKDKFSGKSLNIVHRDISPQNLIISYDGAVKVIDFGIAKAVTNAESTRAGVIKGKPSYLSPEQISGDTLDGRSDLFALGTVLWELLAGRKLFAADNDFGVLKLIENCNNYIKPPSLYNSKVPKELDAIVLKCLQKNVELRYSTAEELQRALHKFLYQFAPEFNPADLAYYARDLFKNEIVEDRKKLLKLNEKAEQLLITADQEASAPALDLDGDAGEATQAMNPPAKAKGGQTRVADRSGSFRMVDFKTEPAKADVKLDYSGTKTTARGTNSGAFSPAPGGTKFAQQAARTGKNSYGNRIQANRVSAVDVVAGCGCGSIDRGCGRIFYL